MGFYINETKTGMLLPLGKAKRLVEDEGAQYVPGSFDSLPEKFSDVPEGKTLVVVVENGFFDAALVLDDEKQFNYAMKVLPNDQRPYAILIMDKKRAFELARIPEGAEA